ncbi:hypothetical protein N7495_004853 [Penicillium taxi]|uniref:uncharacterized protein n=1 Tax=Penicillium taxi TaxID=168475 RepID=UPI00254539A8|nr:uncharacterized protein N7495_004853 [Penicillium taxi]KAJ5900109.1 hypothetical protein N7495_004853 [Penicillium taxi]
MEKDGICAADNNGSHVDETVPGDAIRKIREMKAHHHWDANLPDEIADEMDQALQTTDRDLQEGIAQDLLQVSPYPEVLAAVPNFDEGGTGNTLRAWIFGLFFTTLGAACNLFFSMRNPSISLSTYIPQLLCFPFGKAWEKWMPAKSFKLFGVQFNTNPGRFTKKEHALVVIMANASYGVAYATDILLAQKVFYKQSFGWGFELLLCICTQMVGFGMAGIFHKFLVNPAAMIWPSVLINTAMFSALHDHEKPAAATVSGWTLGRNKMFTYSMAGSFFWYFFPGYIAPFLSVFVFVTWIKPQNVVINQLLGGYSGLALLPITFDWTTVTAFTGSPLMTPWFAIGNCLIGLVVFFFILTPGIHYSGLFYNAYLPMSDSRTYANTGHSYKVANILTPEFLFDEEKYRNYSPLFLSTTFMLTYGLSFASVIAVVVHAALFHGKDIWNRMCSSSREDDDIHYRLMMKYKQVPLWWYGVVFVVMVGVSFGVVLGYPTHFTWWAFLISLVIPFIWWLPIGVLAATANIGIGLNVITEFIIGYMQPGRPMAMMLFKTFGYITLAQGQSFTSDMKLGHYMKIPPRLTFWAQMVAAFWAAIIQVGVLNWSLDNIEGICTPDQKNKFSCPVAGVFFNASVIWGVIGPARIFSIGQMYGPLVWFWLVGALLPVAIYVGARIFPRSPIRFLNAPIIFGGTGNLPPASTLNYLSWGIVGFVFQKYIRNRHRGWWLEYNYVLSAGLDVGLMLCTLLIFFALQFQQIEMPDWWGNTVGTDTLDSTGKAVQVILPEGQIFGPKTW